MNIEYILKKFDYNPVTGELYRVLKGGSRVLSGTECNGYNRSMVKGELQYNHRIAWCHYYREQPPEFIDHINQNRKDNSIKNLRGCSLSLNQTNRKLSCNNTTGFTGVSYIPRIKKFKATIYKNSKAIHLGVYKNAKEANEAYLKAKGIYHGR